jgi:hypothetical protein
MSGGKRSISKSPFAVPACTTYKPASINLYSKGTKLRSRHCVKILKYKAEVRLKSVLGLGSKVEIACHGLQTTKLSPTRYAQTRLLRLKIGI